MKNFKRPFFYQVGYTLAFLVLLFLSIGAAHADDLNAMFATAPSSGPAPLNVSFIDQSEGFPVNWTWDFDDETPVVVTTNPNPTHTYTTPGEYFPSLIVDNNTGVPPIESTYFGAPIRVYPPVISANFSGIPQFGYAPLHVSFIDQSTGPITNWDWNFDENGIDPETPHTASVSRNPTHTYVNPGSYRVNLTIGDNYSSVTDLRDLITVYPLPPPEVDFTASPRSGNGSLEVAFTNLVNGTGPLSYEWDFGDETPIVYEAHPAHTYSDEGIFNVSVEVTGAGGATLVKKNGYISVGANPPPIADFAVTPSEGFAPLQVSFTGLGEGDGVLQYSWDLGDGIGQANGRNPTYTYTAAGNYNVTCTVTDGTKTGQVRRDHCVRVLDKPLPVISFAASPTFGEKPLNVTFIDLSYGVNESPEYHWDFGDGVIHSTTDKTYLHRYATSGIWTPQLWVESDGVLYTGGPGTPITVINPPLPTAMFTASSRNGTAPLEVEFIDQSIGIRPLSYKWNFGDGSPLSHDKNPVHIYEEQGIYNVSLMISTSDGDDLIEQKNFITVHPQALPDAEFTATPRSGSSPLIVSFIDQSTGVGQFGHEWNFGDGSPVSHEKNPVHQYDAPGLYSVNLTITSDSGFSIGEKQDYIRVLITNYPEADFAATPKNGTAPLTVSFIDQSRLNPLLPEPAQYLWTFGDNTSSHLKSPEHTYMVPGIYAVNLSVTHGGKISEQVTTTIEVNPADDPKGMFTATPRKGSVPLTVSFIDQSIGTGPFTWKWDFGDATPLNYDQNPVHTYQESGVYNVTLQVIGPLGSSVVYQKSFIEVSHTDDPIAMFTASPANGTSPLEVSFIDQSTGLGPLSWEWDFGDGSPLSNNKNPFHVYQKPGIYNVTLFVKNPNGQDLATQIGLIKVQSPELPKAGFVGTPVSGTTPLSVSFIDQSVGQGLLYQWDFGDGSPVSYDKNPVHEFMETGLYTVNLTVANDGGSSTTIKEEYISVTHAIDVKASFNAYPREGSAPLEVAFFDQSVGQEPIRYEWYFGDNTPKVFDNPNPVHVFTEPGEYNVTLMIHAANGKDIINQNRMIRVGAYPVPNVSFSMAPLVGNAPLKVSFIDQTCEMNCGYQYFWEFGDGNTSSKKNPVYEYKIPGKYLVNLTVTDAWGVSKKLESMEAIEALNPLEPEMPLKASFSAVPRYGNPPLLVSFVDTSIVNPPVTYQWFIDNELIHSERELTHLFSQEKDSPYVVKLKINSADGSDEFSEQIEVHSLIADFKSDPIVENPLSISFADVSPGYPTGWYWLFGDGHSSRSQNPEHTYNRSGAYQVSLYVWNDLNKDMTVKEYKVF